MPHSAWGVNALYVHSERLGAGSSHPQWRPDEPTGQPAIFASDRGDSHDYSRVIRAMYATLESQDYRLHEPYGVQLRPDGSRVLMLQEKFATERNSQVCRDAENRTDRYSRCDMIYNGTRPLFRTRHWGYPDAPEWAHCARAKLNIARAASQGRAEVGRTDGTFRRRNMLPRFTRRIGRLAKNG